jgi:Flp pilus assembly protein TadG
MEFAIVAPILGMFVVGIADLGRGFSERHALQQAANRTMELAHLGTTTGDYTFLPTQAVAAAGTGSTATLDDWLECGEPPNAVRNNDWDGTCAAGQQVSRYIKLTINKNFRPSFSTVGYPNVVNGQVPLTANVTLRVQ